MEMLATATWRGCAKVQKNMETIGEEGKLREPGTVQVSTSLLLTHESLLY